MNFKDTLLMPNTKFEMRGNLVKKEPKILKRWQDNAYYQEMLKANEGKEEFILHDGPPYANGNLHSGTAMNRVIKDFIVRSKNMGGYYAPFTPGWDTHGLPIENAVIKQGVDPNKVSDVEFRQACEDYAWNQLEIQKQTMKRLGTIADFDDPYITMTKEFEANQVKSFAKMATQGLIYQGLRPVYWSPASQSALAESEIVYRDVNDPNIFVMFDLIDGQGELKDARFVIWTTTPWTIPANLGISLNPGFDYALVKTEKGNLIMLAQNVDELLEKFGLENQGIIKIYKGVELENLKAQHPLLDDVQSLIMVGNHVSDDGTGCVHTAPGHGIDDFNIGSKYGLKPFSPVDAEGKMTAEAGLGLEGKTLDEANKIVGTMLEEKGHLLLLEFVTHSYPFDERMRQPVIFRSTVQWFASIDPFREKALSELDKVKWENEWGKVRLYNMIENRGDWTISRQRKWGLPIPIIFNEDNSPILEQEVFDHIEALFREHGSKVWYEYSAKELLPEGYTNEKSPNGNFRKEKDTLDIWFDAGTSFNVMLDKGHDLPMDLYFEGSDQYRGWFNSSLLISVATEGVAPYRSLMSHGMVLDEKGDKMSKSIGNVLDPNDVIDQYGADIFRIWAASIEFKQDVKIGDSILKQSADIYRKIRNTFRFMLGNLSDFDIEQDEVAYEDLTAFDQYMMVRLQAINKEVQDSYEKYNFQHANNVMNVFMNNDLSAYYLDVAKDVLYIDQKDSLRRRQIQTVIWHAVDILVRLWAPIIVFTAEEVNDHFMKYDSIHNQDFREVVDYENAEALLETHEKLVMLRDDVMKALEVQREAKVIGKPLEAAVNLSLEKDEVDELNAFIENVAQWLTVSKVTFDDAEERILVTKAKGEVCPRCWVISESSREDNVCARCADILGV